MTGIHKTIYKSPMKAYRFKCWGNKLYCDHTVHASNDDHAQQVMADTVNNGNVLFTNDGGFRNSNQLFITFEEVNNNEPTRVSTEEVEIRASVGQPGINTKTSDS